MKLFVRGNHAICPSCSGLIVARQDLYSCVDCKAAYVGVGEGIIEGEVMVERFCGMTETEHSLRAQMVKT